MGLTKQYLRYVASAVFGVIGSQKANITYVTLRGGEKGRYVAVAACEHVFIWDVRKGEKVRFKCDYNSATTHIQVHFPSDFICSYLYFVISVCVGPDPAGSET